VLRRHDGKWDIDHERYLAKIIQEGLAAKKKLEGASEDEKQGLQCIVEQGEQARYDLVVVNLPFAAYFAAASVGRRRLPALEKTGGVPQVAKQDGDYMGILKEPGTYAPIVNLASPRASYEDRLQVAMEAMWRAAEKYSPDPEKKAKFITYAGWRVQSAIEQESLREVGGWYVDKGVFDKYMGQIREAIYYGTPLPVNTHRVKDVGDHDGLPHEQMLKGRELASPDTVKFQAPEEADVFGDGTPLDISDVLADSHDILPATTVEKMIRDEVLYGILREVLTKKQLSVVAMSFGLDDGEQKSFAEIGREYGVTRERIRQIYSQAMLKLKHPSNSEQLLDYRGTDNPRVEFPGSMISPVVDGALGNLKTQPVLRREPAVKTKGGEGAAEPRPPRDPRLESWQTYLGEPFDEQDL
jgi:RNA polymerase sigma factor (sigma-70 family)